MVHFLIFACAPVARSSFSALKTDGRKLPATFSAKVLVLWPAGAEELSGSEGPGR